MNTNYIDMYKIRKMTKTLKLQKLELKLITESIKIKTNVKYEYKL